MAAVPVSLMHTGAGGLQIPAQMMLPACSTMLSMNVPMTSTMTSMAAMNYPPFQPQQPHQSQPQPLSQGSVTNEQYVNGGLEAAMSPSRSLSSASPPTLNGMIQGNSGGSATPTPEENPEYLKELQLEKDNLEAAMASNDNSVGSGGEQLNNEANNEAPNNATVKTNHALKLLEQGKAQDPKTKNNYFCGCWRRTISIIINGGQLMVGMPKHPTMQDASLIWPLDILADVFCGLSRLL